MNPIQKWLRNILILIVVVVAGTATALTAHFADAGYETPVPEKGWELEYVLEHPDSTDLILLKDGRVCVLYAKGVARALCSDHTDHPLSLVKEGRLAAVDAARGELENEMSHYYALASQFIGPWIGATFPGAGWSAELRLHRPSGLSVALVSMAGGTLVTDARFFRRTGRDVPLSDLVQGGPDLKYQFIDQLVECEELGMEDCFETAPR
jgi:hypothetical protein